MAAAVEILRLDAAQVRAAAGELGEVLADCVAGGATLFFLRPFTATDGRAYFEDVAEEVARGEAVLLAAKVGGRIMATVQLGLKLPPNQQHRADLKKLLVHSGARRQGLGAALLTEAERWARELGRTLLVLDTIQGDDGERLYERSGWSRVGVIPNYGLDPDGRPRATVYFYKQLP
jgi:GNAT superfamily N-acetyltransferase